MTREEMLQKQNEIRSQIDAKVLSYNDIAQNGNASEATKVGNDIDELVAEYTGIARQLVFDELKTTENPMIEAVKRLTFPTIAIKDEKSGEQKIPVRTVIDREKPINLAELHKYCGGIGHDKNWVYMIQKLNFLLTAQTCIDLGIDPKAVNDSYAMAAVAAEIDLGKNPTSKTNMLKTLNTIITAMLGDGYKAVSHDVNYLLKVYAKKNRKALVVSCANHKNFTGFIAEICHRIVTGKVYGVEYKAKKAG